MDRSSLRTGIEKNDSTAVEYVGKSSSITLRRHYGEYESRRQTSTNQTGGLSRQMVTWLDSGSLHYFFR